VPYKIFCDSEDPNDLVQEIYFNIQESIRNVEYLNGKTVMCPTIKDVVAINNRVKEYLMEKG
jgi:hypothetical protein